METTGATDLTPRQQKWLSHFRACTEAGETVRDYAKRQGLSEHAMYQAAKDLRQRGLLPPGRPRRSQKSAPPKRPAFVQVSPPAGRPSTWRARLPNGVVLEGTEAASPELLEALSRL